MSNITKNLKKYKYFYILLIPTILYYIIFCYMPMYGITLAFKEFNFNNGIMRSPWVGLKNFNEIFQYKDFWSAFKNTLVISAGRLIFEFPIPIIVALLLNEMSKHRLKSIYQTVFTFPHFLSWIVLSGVIVNLLNDAGIVNQFLVSIGYEKADILVNPSKFRPFIYTTNIWKEVGWSAIIYLAAIAGINPELYEAAIVDGAGRFQRMKAITWPSIKNTVAVLFILAIGNSMGGGAKGFDQIFNLYNPAVYNVSDILDTYIYRTTFYTGASFGVSTAVGLFKSVINFILLYTANYVVKRLGEEGLV